MNVPHPNPGCCCVECRIREALLADGIPSPDDAIVRIDTGPALEALCKLSAEMLAHHPPDDAKAFYFNLLEYIKQWKKARRVMVQCESRGRA